MVGADKVNRNRLRSPYNILHELDIAIILQGVSDGRRRGLSPSLGKDRLVAEAAGWSMLCPSHLWPKASTRVLKRGSTPGFIRRNLVLCEGAADGIAS